MRFVLALISFLLGGLLVAVGVAEQTVLKPADHITVASATPNVHYLLIPASTLRTNEGKQLLKVQASDPIWVGTGFTDDVRGWLAGSTYASAKVTKSGKLVFTTIKDSNPDKTVQPVADPAGSDMWLAELNVSSSLSSNMNAAEGQSLLLTTGKGNGTFQQMSMRWAILAQTPYALSFIAFGIVLALLGLLFVAWGMLHLRQFTSKPRSFSFGFITRLRKLGAASIALLVALVTTVIGSSSAGATELPQQVSSMTEVQAMRVIERITDTIAKADAERDVKVLAERMAGPVLEQRQSNYRILAKDKSAATLQPIPQNANAQLILPQAIEAWPRTFFAVLSDTDAKQLPVALLMKQDSARANYKIWYATTLQAGSKLPALPNAVSGSQLLSAQTNELTQKPTNLASAYGLLLRDSDSSAANQFNVDDDYLLAAVGESAKKAAAKAVGSTAKISFSDLPADLSDLIVLKAADGSALVATQLDERWIVTPRKKGVTVKPSGATEILSKTPSTKRGIEAIYGYQLLFSVPKKGSSEKVQLIGYSQGLLKASEVK